MIRNIIFDWSGVLSDDFKKIYEAVMIVFDTIGVNRITLEEFKKEFELPYMRFYQKYRPDVKMVELKKIYLKAILSVGEPKPFPGSFSVLEGLRHIGKRMVVLSSVPRKKFEKEISDYGFRNFFIGIKSGVHDKEEIILDLMKEFGFEAEETAYVGDMNHDIYAGKKARVTTVAVTWGYQRKERLLKSDPDFIVEKMSDLLGIVGKKS